jgi:CRP-like cAMP-binding protein
MDLQAIMKRVELFRGLNAGQLGEVAAISHEQVYEGGATVFEQGSAGDALYIVGAGQVEVKVRDSWGRSASAIYLGEGQVFGEMALIDQGTRSASIFVVDEDTVLYHIPAEDFIDLCTSNTDIGYIMMRNIAQDLSFKLRHHDFNPTAS